MKVFVKYMPWNNIDFILYLLSLDRISYRNKLIKEQENFNCDIRNYRPNSIF